MGADKATVEIASSTGPASEKSVRFVSISDWIYFVAVA
jgi:hypothetical protein